MSEKSLPEQETKSKSDEQSLSSNIKIDKPQVEGKNSFVRETAPVKYRGGNASTNNIHIVPGPV